MPILNTVEQLFNIRYYEAGLFDDNNPVSAESIVEASDLGTVLYGDWNLNKAYLVMRREDVLNIRPVPQKKGGTKYAIDQLVNKESCILKPGGIYIDKILVGGSVGTAHQSVFSDDIIKEFQKNFRRGFCKIGSFYVGKIARQMLDSGFRLVTNIKSPIEYDLKIE